MKPAVIGLETEQIEVSANTEGRIAAIPPASAGMDTQDRPKAGRTGSLLRGGAWIIAGYVSTQLLRTITTLALARYFLEPEAFGVVGLVTVFLSGLTMFSELGIVVSIVQHPRGDDPKFLNTAFSLQAMRGAMIWLVAAAAAYPLSRFYQQPLVFPLLLVAASSEVVRGLISTSAWTLKRHLRLGKITLLHITAEAVGCTATLLWAVLSPSVWVLVARPVASAIVYAIGSHLIAERAVRFRWEASAAREMLKFGGWVSLSTAAYFLAGQGERLILGKFITIAELGCFSLALVIAAAPASGIREVVAQVFLPLISNSVRTSQAQTVHDFRRARLIFFAVAVAAGIGFLLVAKPFVAYVLSPEYRMTGWMLQLLGLRVALDLFAAPASNLILAQGQSRYMAAGNCIRLVFMIIGLAVAFTQFGIREAIASLVLAQALSYLPVIMGLRRLIPEVGRAEARAYIALLLVLSIATLLLFS